MFIHDTVESNGKTIKENNLTIDHNIPLDSLVEVNNCSDDYDGVRAFVVKYSRDCDGTPLYGISLEKGQRFIGYSLGSGQGDICKMLDLIKDGKIENGFPESCLTIISK